MTGLENLVYLPLWAMILLPLGTFVVGVILTLFFWRAKPTKSMPIYEVKNNKTSMADVKAAKPGEGIGSYQRIKGLDK